MKFLVEEKRVIIYGFVIMPNHIHLLWHLRAGKIKEDVQRNFLRHTAQEIKSDMLSRLNIFEIGEPHSRFVGKLNTMPTHNTIGVFLS